MARKRTYIREWRKLKGFTLDQMVERLAALDVKITGASLSRIERGSQPYSQDIMEAMAESLAVTVSQLVEDNPAIPSAPVANFIQHLSDAEARQAEAVLRAMFKDSA